MPYAPPTQWPGPDDTLAVDAMLDDSHLLYEHYWQQCQIFVDGLVKIRAGSFSKDEKEEIAQNTMLTIVRCLRDFKRESKLTTWITKITLNRIADAGRERQALQRYETLPPRDPDDNQQEDFASKIRSPKTTEEESMLREELRDINKRLREHLSTHSNRERTIRIFDMYLKGLSQEEIARELDMPSPNVGYAIRSVQQFLRKHR